MRVLLSAFACAPEHGSEPGFGWEWALTLAAMGHEVTVLTMCSLRQVIEDFTGDPRAPLVRFIYLGHPRIELCSIRSRFLFQLYYSLWQCAARRVARRLQAKCRFDVIHSVTVCGVRFPCFLGRLGPPLIMGPLGGAEVAPVALSDALGFPASLIERLRRLLNRLARIDPLLRLSFSQADSIIVRTAETRDAIPRRYRHKVRQLIGVGIGIDQNQIEPTARCLTRGKFRVLFAGRFLHWKGMSFGLPAFAQLLQTCPEARLTMAGDGPERTAWQELAQSLGIAGQVDWIGWQTQSQLLQLYREHDVFLFPSLHDAGGMAVVEALARGVPVVCFDLGGPGCVVDEEIGERIATAGLSPDQAIAALAQGLRAVRQDDEHYRRMSANAIERVRGMSWAAQIEATYSPALRGVWDSPASPADAADQPTLVR